MARDILAKPATPVPAEALYSRVGKLTTKIHNRSKPPPIKKFTILKTRGVLQNKRPPGIVYDLGEFELGDDDDAIGAIDDVDAVAAIDTVAVDAVEDDQDDWLGKNEDHTEVDSLVVGNAITEVFYQSADSLVSSETG